MEENATVACIMSSDKVFSSEGSAPLMYNMEFSGRYRVWDCDTREWFSCPESYMWLGLGNKIAMVWVREMEVSAESQVNFLSLSI